MFQTIKYLISILIKIECINISLILTLINCSESLAYPFSQSLIEEYNQIQLQLSAFTILHNKLYEKVFIIFWEYFCV